MTVSRAAVLAGLLTLLAPLRAGDCNSNGIDDRKDILPAAVRFEVDPRDGAVVVDPTSPRLVADVNGDGGPDVIAATGSTTPATVSIRLNDGSGGFLPPSVLVLDMLAFIDNVAVLEFDGRPGPELAVAGRGTDGPRGVWILENDGTGKYSVGERHALDEVLAGDLDGDGDTDLAWGDARIRNRSDVPTDFVPRSTNRSALLVDLNGDGAAERVVGRSVARNRGDGVFQAPIFLEVASGSGVDASDIDADGDVDLIIGNSLFENDGLGRFGTPRQVGGRNPLFRDVDGDGNVDMVVARFAVFPGLGDGDFGPAIEYGVEGDIVDVADLDGDGDLDALLPARGGFRVASNLGGFVYSIDRLATVEVAGDPFYDDFDGDGLIDAAVVEVDGRTVSLAVRRNDGSARFDDTPARSSLAGPLAGPLVTADLDGDGATDVVAGGSVLLGNGDGRFAPPIELPVRFAVDSERDETAVVDLDGDGVTDLAFLSRETRVAQPILSLGNGRFEAAAPVQVPGEADEAVAGLAAADLDRDGDGDLVVALACRSNGLGALLIFDGMGDGSFDEPASIIAACQLLQRSVHAADLDGDGTADLLARSSTGLHVFLNDGGGNFGPATIFGAATEGAPFGDADGDGDLDLLARVRNNRGVVLATVFVNDGRGGFFDAVPADIPLTVFLPHLAGNGVRPRFAAQPVDLDADGRTDLVAGLTFHPNVTEPVSQDRNANGVPDECERPRFHRGDPNDDGQLNLTDAVATLDFLFQGGATPGCLEAADANNDGVVNITDAIGVLGYLFLGAAAPVAPGPPPAACGADTDESDSPGDLGCDIYESCEEA